jgi:hypothetical protein
LAFAAMTGLIGDRRDDGLIGYRGDDRPDWLSARDGRIAFRRDDA